MGEAGGRGPVPGAGTGLASAAGGWRTLVLSSHTEFERSFGRPAAKKRKLYNGMIKCDLFMYGNV